MATSDKCEAASTVLPCETKVLFQNLKDSLIQDISELYMSRAYSDVILLVAEEQIYAHKLVLAARNPYFSALLFGDFAESSKKEIELKDVGKGNLSSFKVLLKYLYCGIVPFKELTALILLDLARLVKLYSCTGLEKITMEYLDNMLNTDNVLGVYSQAVDYHFDEVIHICLAYMDKNAVEVMKRSEFDSLTIDCAIHFTSRDSIVSDELGIFQAVQSWIRANPDADATELLRNVRLNLMPVEHIMTSVTPSGLYTRDDLMAAIEKKWEMGDTKLDYCRTAPLLKINLTDEKSGARVLVGDKSISEHNLLRKISNSDNKNGYAEHKITDDQKDGIIIDLGCRRMVNHMQMLLTDNITYCYYIEVSVGEKSWVRVVDHSTMFCFGLQNLYFQSTITQYIRIVGTKASPKGKEDTEYFRVAHFEAYFTNDMKEFSSGFLVAKENVATLARGARATYSGNLENIEALLSHDSKRNAAVPCGSFLQGKLPQPYIVNSIRFFLSEKYYHYYTVKVFGLKKESQVAKMCGNKASFGWQNILLKTPEVVSTIKIYAEAVVSRGSHPSREGAMFHCSHFECPSSIQE